MLGYGNRAVVTDSTVTELRSQEESYMAPKEKPGKADMAEGPEAARALRESLGMTKEKFAQALGVSRIAVLFWEKGP